MKPKAQAVYWQASAIVPSSKDQTRLGRQSRADSPLVQSSGTGFHPNLRFAGLIF